MNTTLASSTLQFIGIPSKTLVRFGLVLGGSLLVALLAQISIPLPFTPVPITGQTLGVTLVGAVLGARLGALSLVLYLAQGLMGLPFFSGGEGGLQHIHGATGGYLVGMVISAYLTGYLAERSLDRKVRTAIPAFILGSLPVFFFGIAWLSRSVGLEQAILLGFVPFIPGGIIKAAIAGAMLPSLWNLFPREQR